MTHVGGKFMVPTVLNLFQGLEEIIAAMFTDIFTEFITIYQKSDSRIESLEQESCEMKNKIEELENMIYQNDASERRMPSSSLGKECLQ